MTQPRVLILRAPGTNCNLESAFAFEQAGARTTTLHVNRLLEAPDELRQFQILCLPGGFSYGDDLGAGRILATRVHQHLHDHLREFHAAGKLILGICNGFQILIKLGLLLEQETIPPGARALPLATLTNNDSGKFEDRWVPLHVSGSTCVFFSGLDQLYLPVAHAEGKFVPRDERVLATLEARGQLALRYGKGQGSGASYPDNPNGSVADVAGVCDPSGRVCGLMPHPERHLERTQHPRWTRGEAKAQGDGLAVFSNAVRYFR